MYVVRNWQKQPQDHPSPHVEVVQLKKMYRQPQQALDQCLQVDRLQFRNVLLQDPDP